MAATFLSLPDAGENMRVLPTARVSFKHALTAQWVAQYPPAVDGFYNEGVRQRKNLANTVAESGWEAAQAAEDLIRGTTVPSPADVSARNFRVMCDDLDPAGAQAYAMYRLLCSYTHASSHTVDAYFQADPLEVFTYPHRYDESDSRVWL